MTLIGLLGRKKTGIDALVVRLAPISLGTFSKLLSHGEVVYQKECPFCKCEIQEKNSACVEELVEVLDDIGIGVTVAVVCAVVRESCAEKRIAVRKIAAVVERGATHGPGDAA